MVQNDTGEDKTVEYIGSESTLEISTDDWKALAFELDLPGLEGTFKRKLLLLWGWDAWFNGIPFFKSILLVNILLWVFLLWRI